MVKLVALDDVPTLLVRELTEQLEARGFDVTAVNKKKRMLKSDLANKLIELIKKDDGSNTKKEPKVPIKKTSPKESVLSKKNNETTVTKIKTPVSKKTTTTTKSTTSKKGKSTISIKKTNSKSKKDDESKSDDDIEMNDDSDQEDVSISSEEEEVQPKSRGKKSVTKQVKKPKAESRSKQEEEEESSEEEKVKTKSKKNEVTKDKTPGSKSSTTKKNSKKEESDDDVEMKESDQKDKGKDTKKSTTNKTNSKDKDEDNSGDESEEEEEEEEEKKPTKASSKKKVEEEEEEEDVIKPKVKIELEQLDNSIIGQRSDEGKLSKLELLFWRMWNNKLVRTNVWNFVFSDGVSIGSKNLNDIHTVSWMISHGFIRMLKQKVYEGSFLNILKSDLPHIYREIPDTDPDAPKFYQALHQHHSSLYRYTTHTNDYLNIKSNILRGIIKKDKTCLGKMFTNDDVEVPIDHPPRIKYDKFLLVPKLLKMGLHNEFNGTPLEKVTDKIAFQVGYYGNSRLLVAFMEKYFPNKDCGLPHRQRILSALFQGLLRGFSYQLLQILRHNYQHVFNFAARKGTKNPQGLCVSNELHPYVSGLVNTNPKFYFYVHEYCNLPLTSRQVQDSAYGDVLLQICFKYRWVVLDLRNTEAIMDNPYFKKVNKRQRESDKGLYLKQKRREWYAKYGAYQG